MRVRVPHTWVLLFSLVAVAATATHWIPAGGYDRVESGGRSLVDPDSYHRVEASPAGVTDVLLAFPRGLLETAPIVFFILLIGGAFGVVQATGAIEVAVDAVAAAAGKRGAFALPILMLLFAVGGGTIGMAEETLAFLPALVLLARRLGYDDVTGGAIALVGAGAGFAGAFLNPFTVGVAQGIAGLPLFSGLGFRLLVWATTTGIAIVYVARYAARIRREPATERPGRLDDGALSRRHTAAVVVVLLATLAGVVVGTLVLHWGLIELSGLFLAAGIVAGLVGGLGASGTAEAFVAGASALTGGALVVGLARGVLVVLDGAQVTDTVLHAMTGALAGLPATVGLVGIYLVQVALNFLVPSGSGQAALSIPILAPLGDLVGISRQTSVLAYQLGDGFTNIFTPTSGYFMAGLALIDVPWTRWAAFIWRLQLLWIVAGLGLLLLSHAIGWGPF
ncbi:MAG: AbgT family transporter [Thermoanaerobaculia bacterium]